MKIGGRRTFLKTGAAAAAASVFPAIRTQAKTGPGGGADGRSNFLFLMTDQHRFDALGFLGRTPVATPNLDRLGAEGTHFSRAYCPSPACGPSRASLFTGVYPASSGHRRNADAHHGDLTLFTERLRRAGYFTSLVGKRHLHPIEAAHGFDRIRLCDAHYATYDEKEGERNAYFDYLANLPDTPSRERIVREGGKTERLGWKDPRFWVGERWQPDHRHLTSWTSREACRFLNDYDGDKPFFLNVSFFGPHHPYTTAWPWTELHDPEAVELPATLREAKTDPVFQALKAKMRAAMAEWDEKVWRRAIAEYYGYVSQIDRAIGEIFNALQERRQWENTWIVFASDHGDHLGNWGLLGKADPYETAARIPLLVRSPASAGIDRRGHTEGRCVNWMDLHATFSELAGDESWRADDRLESRSLVPLLTGEDAGWRDETALFWGREPDRYSMAFWRGDRKVVRLRRPDGEAIELYDVRRDPWERNNLYPQVRDKASWRGLIAAARRWGDGQERRFR